MVPSIGTLSIYNGLKQAVLRKSSLRFPLLRVSSAFQEIGQKNGISTTSPCNVKEITLNEEENKIVIEGKYISSPREKYLAKFATNITGCQECSLCKLGLKVRHTDVLIINQFINSKGKQLPRDVTGLCSDQHRRMQYLIVMAEKAGLIDRDVERVVKHNNVILYEPEEWEEPHFKKYYDESVIEEFLYKYRRRH